jgi:hypothetical protein
MAGRSPAIASQKVRSRGSADLYVRYFGRFSNTSLATGSAEKALGQPT